MINNFLALNKIIITFTKENKSLFYLHIQRLKSNNVILPKWALNLHVFNQIIDKEGLT